MHSVDGSACVACEAGKHPNGDHTTCDDCAADSAGKTGLCTTCDPGKQPNHAHTKCIACGPNKYSADGSPCQDCLESQTANADKSGCDDAEPEPEPEHGGR